ncbi:unnamed protein product [Phytophthora lilii]|uniref:Unnamed protein product n=1 Tax=Phytophthora lilii TaxID=2077276 RepID=A0A9W6UAY8_9STRA|nr:unnamed protein product [Phytophthora lilii]
MIADKVCSLKPIVDTKSGVKVNQYYYFSEPTAAKPFYIKKPREQSGFWQGFQRSCENSRYTFNSLMIGFEDIERYVYKNDDPPLKKNLEANIQLLNRAILDNTKSTDTSARIKSYEGPQYRDDTLQKLHDDSKAAFLKYGEPQWKYDEAKLAIKRNNSKSARSALKAATAAMKATKAVYQIKAKSYSDAKLHRGVGSGVKRKLQGRGLRGAGVAPLEGFVRRGRTCNLNEIQGLATPYIYRQLGSKYIRIPDLDAKPTQTPPRRLAEPTGVMSATSACAEQPPQPRPESVQDISPAPKSAHSLKISGDQQDEKAAVQSAALLKSKLEGSPAPQSVTHVLPESSQEVQAPGTHLDIAPSLAHSQKYDELPNKPLVQAVLTQQRFQVPDALRSAIAQVVSQRQELLNSRHARQPNLSDSDYGLSSDEEDDFFLVHAREKKQLHQTVSDSSQGSPAPASPSSSQEALITASRLTNHGIPAIAKASSISSVPHSDDHQNPSLVEGSIPPLLTPPRSIDNDTNIERKRAFFSAKKLAFEQFKWIKTSYSSVRWSCYSMKSKIENP